MTPEQIAKLDRLLLGVKPLLWKPFPGPQTQAFKSEADELFYGGAAGGGKTALGVGLAVTSHKKTLFLRRQAVQLTAAVQYLKKVAGSKGWSGSGHGGTMRLDGGSRIIEMAGCDHEDDREKYQGRDHDLKVFDELSHFSRTQYRFISGWCRTDDPGQRARVVATGNPPTTPEGRWVVEEWAPWLDREHPDPASPGELRWYTVIDDRLVWFRTGEEIIHKGERIRPRSRTFIPARLQDNPVYMATGYMATLQALPEPLRSQMLYGDMNAGLEDDPWQVIPTAWIQAAQKRWTPGPPEGFPMSQMGVDVARGGKDKTVISTRYGTWFSKLVKHPGSATPDGPKAAARVIAVHDGECPINIDVIGIGSSAYDCLKGGMPGLVHPINNSEKTTLRDRSGKLGFVNVRAASYWKLREALDPEHGENLALPPDPELLADLASAHYEVTTAGIKVESKEDIIKRLGRSPDCADAVVLCHWQPRRLELNVWV